LATRSSAFIRRDVALSESGRGLIEIEVLRDDLRQVVDRLVVAALTNEQGRREATSRPRRRRAWLPRWRHRG
jgi:hypothetical protein